MSNSRPRETVEFQEVQVQVDGVPVTDFQVALVPYDQRPAGWTTAVTLDGKHGVMISGLPRGTYRIWARVVSVPETPVVDCGLVLVT